MSYNTSKRKMPLRRFGLLHLFCLSTLIISFAAVSRADGSGPLAQAPDQSSTKLPRAEAAKESIPLASPDEVRGVLAHAKDFKLNAQEENRYSGANSQATEEEIRSDLQNVIKKMTLVFVVVVDVSLDTNAKSGETRVSHVGKYYARINVSVKQEEKLPLEIILGYMLPEGQTVRTSASGLFPPGELGGVVSDSLKTELAGKLVTELTNFYRDWTSPEVDVYKAELNKFLENYTGHVLDMLSGILPNMAGSYDEVASGLLKQAKEKYGLS